MALRPMTGRDSSPAWRGAAARRRVTSLQKRIICHLTHANESPNFCPLLALSFRMRSLLSSRCFSICARFSSLLNTGAGAAALFVALTSCSSSSGKSFDHAGAPVGTGAGGCSDFGESHDGTGVVKAATAALLGGADAAGAAVADHESSPHAASSLGPAAILSRSAPVLLIPRAAGARGPVRRWGAFFWLGPDAKEVQSSASSSMSMRFVDCSAVAGLAEREGCSRAGVGIPLDVEAVDWPVSNGGRFVSSVPPLLPGVSLK